MEDSKQAFVKYAIDLFSNHNVKQHELFSLVRESLLKHVSGLPKRKVLYNDCYGGFSFSEEFEKYLQEVDDKCTLSDYENIRGLAVPHIVPFGQSIIKNQSLFPSWFGDMLYVYEAYNLKRVIQCIKSIHRDETTIPLLNKNAELLKTYLESSPTEPVIEEQNNYYKPSHWLLQSDKPGFKSYKIADLEDLLAGHQKGEFVAAKQQSITKSKDEILALIPEHIFGELDASIKQPKKQCSRPYTIHKDEVTFIELVQKYGFDHKKTWEYQEYYTDEAIFYLLNKYKSSNTKTDCKYDVIREEDIKTYQDDILERSVERFGLLCASDVYSQLALAEIPALVDYHVGEYDGKEQVYVV